MPPISSDISVKLIVLAIALFFFVTAWVSFAIKIVPENKRVVIFRLGRSIGSRGPGIVTILPVIDLALWVDLQSAYRYKYSALPTADNQKISCALTLEGKVIDPEKCVLNVPNLKNALSQIIETELVDIARSKKSAELIDLGGWIEGQLKDVLDRSSRSWGFEVTRLMIEAIQPTQA